MTGLKFLIIQVHPKDQSLMNLALLWENTGYLEPGIQSSKYYHGIVNKRLNTKKYSCVNHYVKHYQCVDNFLMKQMNCSFPWIKSYNGSLPNCWANRKVFELVNLMRNLTDFKGLYHDMTWNMAVKWIVELLLGKKQSQFIASIEKVPSLANCLYSFLQLYKLSFQIFCQKLY